jgi:hypothetical protein
MPKKTKLPQLTALRSDAHIKQGLRLTNVFSKLQNVHDREKVIALAERLLDEQNAN